MSLTVDIDLEHATFIAAPEFGRTITFEVRWREINVSPANTWGAKRIAGRWVVGLKGGNGHGFAQFTSFEKACRSALFRARRYDRAYSVPRCVPSRTEVAA